jgi:hypothetical protein
MSTSKQQRKYAKRKPGGFKEPQQIEITAPYAWFDNV